MITVNLTTTFSRQEVCAQAIYSLIQQSAPPDKIVLWISSEPHLRDTGINSIPTWISELNKIQHIIEVNWTINTGPYRKLLPALMSANEGDIIITADDDIIYGKNWLRHLIDNSNRYPDHIIAARVRKITHNSFGIRKSYSHWPIITKNQSLISNFIITHGGGAVFRAASIKPYLIADQSYIEICPTTDDLWFSELIINSGTPVLTCTEALDELRFIEHDEGLDNYNNLKTTNTLSKIYKHLILKPLGWLGFSICENGTSLKKIEKHISTVLQPKKKR